MFGYVMVNKDELKIKEYKRYQMYYCGLCMSLKKKIGVKGRILLSYDMTFMAMLLTSLNEPRSYVKTRCCIAKPMGNCRFIENEYIDYAADMSILLSYQNFCDDWKDDRSLIKYISASILKKAYDEVRKKYTRQGNAVDSYVKKLAAAEKRGSHNPEEISGLTGDMLKEIFIMNESVWDTELYQMGYYLGKFIYIMDAYEDMDEDIKKSHYNPLMNFYNKSEYNEKCKEMLIYMAAQTAKAMERLPLVKDVMIIRNILYSGIWTKYTP